jgi:microcystin-dependent protein
MCPWSGSAPNQTFTRTDGTRTGPETWKEANSADIGILSAAHDTHDEDLADGVEACLKKDGGNQPTAAMPWNNQRITGYGTPAARTDAQRVDKVQDSVHTYAGESSGTDTITATLSPAITAYVVGQRFTFLAGGTNTGAATIDFNEVDPKDIKKGPAGATALDAGDITEGGFYTVEYDGTNFQLLNPATLRIAGTIIIGGTAAAAAAITLGEDTDNGAHAVTLQAAASLAGNLTFTLPNADGAAGQSLQTNGSGVLSFGSPGPIGAIVAWPTATAPTGWLECSGAAVSRATYATLFGLISDDYGAGDGSTTFNLPDLRGRFVRGWDHGATLDPDRASRTDRGDGTTGDNVGTKQADAFKAHTHTYSVSSSGEGAVDGDNNGPVNANTGSTGGNETRPVNINMMYIIRAL